jgi:excinuclease ABC subunit B
MYADEMTSSMRKAIEETNRRRDKQVAYNIERGVDPQPLRKRIADILDEVYRDAAQDEAGRGIGGSGRAASRGKAVLPGLGGRSMAAVGGTRTGAEGMARADLLRLIQDLTDQMLEASAELKFELAARIRDEVNELKRELRGMEAAGVR